MFTLNTITRKTELNSAVLSAITAKFGTRTERITAEVIFNYYVLGLGLKSLKRINLVHNFSNRQIIAIAKNFENASYVVTFDNNTTSEVSASEGFTAFKKPSTVACKAKTADKNISTSYVIALVKKTKFGNNQYLLKDGSFDTAISTRITFKTMKGAENMVNRLVETKKVKPFSLKVVSAEVC